MIPDFKTYIGESVWGDIRRRGLGSETKEEDNIDLLDGKDFCDYLKGLYNVKEDCDYSIFIDVNYVITVPILRYHTTETNKYSFIQFDTEKKIVYVNDKFTYHDYYLAEKIRKNYNISGYKKDFTNNFQISPKTGETTNKFFIEVIDFIMENKSDHPYKTVLEKTVNESVWGDIRKRGLGDEYKKEDEFDPEYIDPGKQSSVYWTTWNLELDGKIFFKYDDVKDFNRCGWRLPTRDEIKQLRWIKVYNDFKNRSVNFCIDNDNILRLKRLVGQTGMTTKFWTSDKANIFIHNSSGDWAWTYGFDNTGRFDFGASNVEVPYPVFLVKDKKSVNESVWGDIRKRGLGDDIKNEDFRFKDEFLKIKKMELIHPSAEWHLGVDYLWTPCNFGAESYDQPGLYLNSEEIVELHDFLKGTDYEIAGSMAFDILRNRRFEKEKIGETWYYIFGGDDDKKLYIPNFGVYAEGSDKLLKPTKQSAAFYGCYHIEGAGYTQIKNAGKSYLCNTYINSNQTSESDRFQVRLVKRIFS